jgi:hypothetical protein
MDLTLSALNLPLYLATAWMMANRGLTDQLKYRLPLSLRAQVPAIRRFWVYDLLFSTLALPFIMLASHAANYSLFANSHDGGARDGAWLAIYPPLFVLMGFLWPSLATFTIGFGPSKMTASIGDLRDRFLRGPAIQTINDDLDRSVRDYVDRLLAEIRANPKLFEGYARRELDSTWTDPVHPTEVELEGLRGSILAHAEKNFAGTYAALGTVENIPFQDRAKPLMRVPRMTSQEEQWLYEAGIVSVRALRSADRSPVAQISPERFQVLRNGALQLRRSRYRLAAGLALVLISVTGMGSFFARVMQGPVPQQTAQAKAPVIGAANPYQ